MADQPTYSHASAKALEGALTGELQKAIPVVAPAVLSSRGGLVTNRAGALNIEEVISFSAAYTRVSGCTNPDNNAPNTLIVTAVVEDLNILEVLRATRVVSQLTITVAKDKTPISCLFSGSRIEGLYLAGRKNIPPILDLGSAGWDAKRQQLSGPSTQQSGDRPVLSLRVNETTLGTEGYIASVPGFGKFFFGEVLQTSTTVQLTAIRAELGPDSGSGAGPGTGSGCCSFGGHTFVCYCTGGGGGHD